MNPAALFWVSVAISLLCVLRARREPDIGFRDLLFFLSAWQAFNLGCWQRYLGSYEAAAVVLIVLSGAYAARRGLGVELTLTGGDALSVLAYLAGLTVLIPIGLALGFLSVHPIGARAALPQALSYYLFVAPSEELVFRGIVLGLLRRRLRPWPALVVSSLLFATIYTHVAGGGRFPNWTYVAFAFVCGLAYGHSYLRRRTLAAPILVHGSVDFIWRALLTGG